MRDESGAPRSEADAGASVGDGEAGIPSSGVDPSAIDRSAADEVARRIDRRLRELEELDFRDAATRLLGIAVPPPSEPPAPSEVAESVEETERRNLLTRVRAVHATLEPLDIIGRIHERLVEAQMGSTDLGRAMLEACDASAAAGPRTDADRELASSLLEIGETLPRMVRDVHASLVETATGLTASVAAAATRAARSLDPEDRDEEPRGGATAAGDLERAIRDLAEWLGDDPLADLRSAIRERFEPPPPRERRRRRGRSKGGRREAEPYEALRTRWDRGGGRERVLDEIRRLSLVGELLDFRIFLGGFVRSHLLREPETVAAAAADRLGEAVTALRALHGEAERGYRAGEPVDTRRVLVRGLEALDSAETALASLAGDGSATAAATEGLAELTTRIGRFPESMRISVLPDGDEGAPAGTDHQTVEPRGWAEDAFGALTLERLNDTARPYAESLAAAIALLPGARTVLEYNVGAADELSETDDADALRIREELVLGGLDRTADRLQDAVTRLDEVREAAPLVASALLSEAVSTFLSRARAESSLEGRARDVWSSIHLGAELAGTWAEREARRIGRATVALFGWGSSHALGALEKARAAVGADPVAAERVDATVRVIADVEHVSSELPFVYRRLFSYRPLADPSLLVGREAACAALDEHLSRWRSGLTDALLVVGASGVGVSSLLNVCRVRWGDEVDWRSLTLTERNLDESVIAGQLAGALDLAHRPATLAELRDVLDAQPPPPRPRVLAVENLELLYRRRALDPGPIDETLRFMAASDTAVLWITSLPAPAWQVLGALRPGIAGLARVVELMPLDRAGVEAAVLARHQRSGIPLRFEMTPELPIGVRRAYSRAGSEAQRQSLLRTAFFDRLFELSEGYVALAILCWLRSIRLDAETEIMEISWPRAIDFGAWDDLDSAGAFALKAILEHGSLTLSEYAAVFGATEDEAFSVFERLGNLLIIRPADTKGPMGARLRFQRIEPGVRYRIRPVLVRPVERLLTARRLLY